VTRCNLVAGAVASGAPLTDAERAHLTGCPDCAALVALPSNLARARRGAEPGPGFAARMTAGAHRRLAIRRRRRIALGAAAIAAAALLAVVGTRALGPTPRTALPTPAVATPDLRRAARARARELLELASFERAMAPGRAVARPRGSPARPARAPASSSPFVRRNSMIRPLALASLCTSVFATRRAGSARAPRSPCSPRAPGSPGPRRQGQAAQAAQAAQGQGRADRRPAQGRADSRPRPGDRRGRGQPRHPQAAPRRHPEDAQGGPPERRSAGSHQAR
jgi:hypothetical protein